MERTTYQYVVLALLVAVAAALALYRYHAARQRFTPYLTVPLTGAVHVVDLETGRDPRINVNAASLAQLDALPGVSSSIAAQIVALRPITDLAQLAQVRGVGEKRLIMLTELLVCGPLATQSPARVHE
jgi:DNA uptake protein ComE-like DNA-binding protein